MGDGQEPRTCGHGYLLTTILLERLETSFVLWVMLAPCLGFRGIEFFRILNDFL